MRPETSEKVAELFQAARTHASTERSVFLDHECAGDASLRAEVMDLLAHTELANDEDFLAAPNQREWFGATQNLLPPGSTVSRPRPDDRHSVRLVHDSDSPQQVLCLTLLWDRMRIGSAIILGSYSVFLVKNI